MKLDKVEITQKNKNKKIIVIGISSAIILVFLGIASWLLFKDADNDIIKFAQSVISGSVMKDTLAEGGAVQEKPDLKPEEILSLESNLQALGFGYSGYDWGPIPDSVEYEYLGDELNSHIKVESLYALYEDKSLTGWEEGKSDPTKVRPPYAANPGEEPEAPTEIKSYTTYETVSGTKKYYVYARYKYKGEWKKTEKLYVQAFVGGTADLKEAEAREMLQEQWEIDNNEYQEESEKWKEDKKKYDNWVIWRTARNEWLIEQNRIGNLKAREPSETWSNYTAFWVKIAQKTFGKEILNNYEGYSREAVIELNNMLNAQIYDEYGNEREEVRDICSERLRWREGDPQIEFIKPGEAQPSTPTSPDGGGGSPGDGSTGGGSPGGGSPGGGSPGGGSPGGGSPGGGSPGGGSPEAGDKEPSKNNTTEDGITEPTIDKVAPSIQKASILSPVTGNYAKGQEIKIKVDFDKNVYGTDKKIAINQDTSPKLFIKFGEDGENKLATFDSVSGKSIMYTYIITETDNGQLQIGTGDNYIGTVYNESGYKADLKTIEALETDKQVNADTIGPKVEKIEAVSEAGEYKTGSDILIKVAFDEKIYTAKNKIVLLNSTAPVLNISFGEGEIRNPAVEEINNLETYIMYKYKITSEDRGTLKVDGAKAFDGSKKICDAVGNEVVLVAGKDLTGNVITANSELTQISLDKKEITLDLNGTRSDTITATVTPIGTELTWTSSNTEVATIDGQTGTVTAVAIGETTITVEATDGTKAICKVTVKDTTSGITKVQLNKTKLELDLSRTKTANLIATVTPNELPVTWESTDEKVVIVDDTGKVTAIAKGEAEIIVKAKDGTTATCQVKVVDSSITEIEPTSIELNVQNVKVILGKTETIQLKTTIIPSNSNKNTKITYESSDENIATVDNEGKVTIKAKGTVVITATSENNQKAYCAIEVVELTEDSELNDKKDGDVNEDGKIDTTDLLAILRHIAASSSAQIAQKHQEWVLESDKYIFADVNGNGVIDVTDSLKIQRHIAASKNETIKSNHPDWIIE